MPSARSSGASANVAAMLGSIRCCSAGRMRCPAVSGSGWRSAARSSATLRCSCSTSRFPISTPRCACPRAARSLSCTVGCGATMIYVTHDQIEAMTMGTRICIMNGGRVEQVGPPLEVYRRPANTFVAGFLGSPPMNLLPATVADGCLALGAARLALPAPLGAATHAARVVFGIRPEDLAQSGPGRDALAAEVVAVEPLGAETIATLRIDGTDREIQARLGRDVDGKADDMATWPRPDPATPLRCGVGHGIWQLPHRPGGFSWPQHPLPSRFAAIFRVWRLQRWSTSAAHLRLDSRRQRPSRRIGLAHPAADQGQALHRHRAHRPHRAQDNLAPYAALAYANRGMSWSSAPTITRRPAWPAMSCSAWRATPASSRW